MKKVKFKGVTWMRPASVLFLLLISVGCSHNGNGRCQYRRAGGTLYQRGRRSRVHAYGF